MEDVPVIDCGYDFYTDVLTSTANEESGLARTLLPVFNLLPIGEVHTTILITVNGNKQSGIPSSELDGGTEPRITEILDDKETAEPGEERNGATEAEEVPSNSKSNDKTPEDIALAAARPTKEVLENKMTARDTQDALGVAAGPVIASNDSEDDTGSDGLASIYEIDKASHRDGVLQDTIIGTKSKELKWNTVAELLEKGGPDPLKDAVDVGETSKASGPITEITEGTDKSSDSSNWSPLSFSGLWDDHSLNADSEPKADAETTANKEASPSDEDLAPFQKYLKEWEDKCDEHEKRFLIQVVDDCEYQ